MTVRVREYVRGLRKFRDVISSSRQFAEKGGLSPSFFYPKVAMRDEEDSFPIEEVKTLPKEKVNVCERPGQPPIEEELYVEEGEWAYAIIEEGA